MSDALHYHTEFSQIMQLLSQLLLCLFQVKIMINFVQGKPLQVICLLE